MFFRIPATRYTRSISFEVARNAANQPAIGIIIEDADTILVFSAYFVPWHLPGIVTYHGDRPSDTIKVYHKAPRALFAKAETLNLTTSFKHGAYLESKN